MIKRELYMHNKKSCLYLKFSQLRMTFVRIDHLIIPRYIKLFNNPFVALWFLSLDYHLIIAKTENNVHKKIIKFAIKIELWFYLLLLLRYSIADVGYLISCRAKTS